MINHLRASLALTATCLIPIQAGAQEITKAGNADALNLGSSWIGGTPPASGNVALWDSTLAGSNTVSLGADASWQGIRIADPGGLVTLSAGNTLTLGSSGIDMSAATQNLTINSATTIGATQNWAVATSRTLLRSGATTTFGTGTTTTLSGAGIFEIGGTQVLAGDGAIVIDGVQFNNNLQGGTQTRTGTTTLSSGTIRISTSISMFGTGAISLDGGAIGSFNTTGRTIGSNAVNIGGNIQIGGSGVLSTGFIQFNGPVNLGGAAREINAIASSVSTNSGSGAVFTGVVSNGGITKAGSGILTLNNNSNTFTGATTINAGNLAISQSALLNSSSVSLAASGAQLSLGQNGAGTHTVNNLSGVAGSSIRTDFTISGTNANRSLTVNQSTDGTFAGSFTEGGSRAITIIKTGTAKLTLSGTGGYTGGTTVSQGTLAAITNNGALGSSGTVTINDSNTGANNTALLLGNITMARPVTVANEGSGTTTLGANGNAALPTFSGAITLAKDVTLNGTGNTDRLTFTGGIGGTGNVTISGGTNRVVFATVANTYNGSTTVSASSVLQLSTGAASTASFIPDTSVLTVNSGGVVKLAKGANSETIGGLAGSGKVRGHEAVTGIASALVIDGGASQNFGGVLEDGGASGSTLSLTKIGAGAQTLSGINSYSGATTISQGTLALSGSGSIANTPSINVAAGATLDVSTATFTLGVAQTLTGAGTVTGTVGNDTLGGVITASGGNLSIGSLTYSGDGIVNVTPGAAILNVTDSDGLSTSTDPVTINVQGGALAPGQYPVINYTGGIQGNGAGSFVVGTHPGGAYTYTLVNNAGNTSVDLVVASLADVWSGAFSTEWSTASIGGSKNWTLNGLPADYADLHDVQFTDAATGTTVDISAADVTPASVEFNHSTNYTLQGTAAIAGSTGLLKIGTGTLTINNVNKFTGVADILGGTVVVSTLTDGGVDSSLGAGTDIFLGDATLSYTGATTSTDRFLTLTAPGTVDVTSAASTLTLTGSVSGSNALTKTGAGVLEIAGGNSFSGTTQIDGGVFRIADGGTWGNGAITNHAALEVNQSTDLTLTNAISGAGSLVKNGTGTLTITAANSYAGGTTISTGGLNLGNGANNTASAGTGTIDITSGATLSIAWNSGVQVLSNNLTGSGTVIRGGGGEVALTGTNNFSGTYQINTNTLAFRSLNSASGQPKIVIASGASLALGNDFAGQTCTISELSGGGGVNPQFDAASGIKTLAVNQATTTTFSGVMRDATSGGRFLALTKSGLGTLTLSGANTYTGATTISGGTLAVTGSLANTTVTVESGATLGGNGSIGGGITIESAGTHTLAVADTPAGQVTRTIGGLLTLDSGNILTLTAATAPADGTYILATATGGISGSLGTIILAPEIEGDVTISDNSIILTVSSASDYDTWAESFNLTGESADDDDSDGLTNFEEYAFGLDPTNAASVSPVSAPDTSAGTFTYTRRKQALSGLAYTYESSTSLSGWATFSPVSEVSDAGDPVETITVTLPPTLLSESKLFLRVDAQQP